MLICIEVADGRDGRRVDTDLRCADLRLFLNSGDVFAENSDIFEPVRSTIYEFGDVHPHGGKVLGLESLQVNVMVFLIIQKVDEPGPIESYLRVVHLHQHLKPELLLADLHDLAPFDQTHRRNVDSHLHRHLVVVLENVHFPAVPTAMVNAQADLSLGGDRFQVPYLLPSHFE